MRKTLLTRCTAIICLLAIAISCFAAIPSKEAQAKSKDEEFRAVWIAYSNFNKSKGMNKSDFTAYVGTMFDNAVSLGFNNVIVHVRPFGDAMYESKYFPWSVYASGKQGVDPGYDPLEIMVKEAHSRGLKIHAWINPFRVSAGTDIKALSKDNQARKWRTNSSKKDDRYVLALGGKLYYNPSVSKVTRLIVNGVKEIVENYDVDGIHFDDYFYPDMGQKNYTTAFDAPEYNKYAADLKADDVTPLSITDWRRMNINLLIEDVYSAIKEIDSSVVFGISPAGAYTQLDDDYRYCIDFRTWLSTPGYIDYICPQVYWSFNDKNIFPYYETCEHWAELCKGSHVKLYIGLPAYKMNTNTSVRYGGTEVDTEWHNQFLLADMVTKGRTINGVSGFVVFDYSDMVDERNTSAVKWLTKAW